MTDAHTALSLWVDRMAVRSDLAEGDRQAVLALPGHIVQIGGSKDFVKLGEQVDHACLVVSGMAARFGQAKSGERLITAIHIPGDMADLHSAVLPTAATALQSLGGAAIYRVPHRAVLALADERPTLARAFWRDCTVDAAVLCQWALTNARQDAIARIAHLLAELSVRFGVGGRDAFHFDLPLTQTQLGDATNLTPVHINRMLRVLRERKIVSVGHRRVEVLDWRALCSLANFDPTYLHLHRAE